MTLPMTKLMTQLNFMLLNLTVDILMPRAMVLRLSDTNLLQQSDPFKRQISEDTIWLRPILIGPKERVGETYEVFFSLVHYMLAFAFGL